LLFISEFSQRQYFLAFIHFTVQGVGNVPEFGFELLFFVVGPEG
jgi:hypothetical protein